VAENWNNYFSNVNGELSSIALDLELKKSAPDTMRPWLLWVWVYLKSPKPNGLSDSSEFEILSNIEDALTQSLGSNNGAIQAGRITGASRREFYFYGAHEDGFEEAVASAMRQFPGYKYDADTKEEADWNQYLNLLYPSEEDRERMKNSDLLHVLEEHGDQPERVRPVDHWIFFRTAADRDHIAEQASDLGYKVVNKSEIDDKERPYSLHISREQSVTPDVIDEAVVELFRYAKLVDAEYDGWETSVETGKPVEPKRPWWRKLLKN